MIDVDNLNRSFPKFPITIRDKEWVYGVWYCGTSYTPVILHGQYPPTFLKRALALFPDIPEHEILHCPSGTLAGHGINVDAVIDEVRRPQVCCLVTSLPFSGNSFSLILSDPPYSPADSKKYGCDPWPMRKAMMEFHRVLKPGGYLGMLHTRYPVFTKQFYALRGLIAVVCGAGRLTRMFSIFERLGEDQQSRAIVRVEEEIAQRNLFQ